MHRALINLASFFVTFLIGVLFVSGSGNVSRITIANIDPNEVTPPSLVAIADNNEKEYIQPEFRDLTDDELAYAGSTENLIDIFETGGIYRESEVIARTGEEWLTLFERNGKFFMAKSRAKVVKKKTTSYAGDEQDVQLTFDKLDTPIFAIRRFWWLQPGPVRTVYHRPSWQEIERRNLPIEPMKAGYKREFNLNENWYTLRVTRGLSKEGTTIGVLVLENNGTTQVIAQNYDEWIGDLLWVGDLDNDGKLDLYFDEFNEKGYFGVGLHLSSSAEPGKLVRLVATFSVAGC